MDKNLHLDEANFAALLADRMRADDLESAHVHLLACRCCRAEFFAYDEVATGLYVDQWYGTGVARAWRAALERPALETPPFDHSAALAAEEALEHWKPQTWPFRMANDPRFRCLDASTYFLRRARQWWQEDPRKAVWVTTGVIRVLESSTAYPERLKANLLARAWAYLGNARRILDRFEEAHQAFREANRWYARSSGRRALAGEILWLEGVCYTAERESDVAISALEDACALLPLSGSPTTRLDAEISLANTYREAGCVEASIQALERLVDCHSPASFPEGTYLATLQNLAMGYVQTGRVAEAKAHLPEIKRLAAQDGKYLNLLRVKWLEAAIYKAECETVPGLRLLASARFREVQAGFLTVGHHMDAALIGLSHAEMYLQLEDSAAAADLAEELIPIFRSKGIHREATAAGLIVVEDLRRKAATVNQVQELTARLRRLRRR